MLRSLLVSLAFAGGLAAQRPADPSVLAAFGLTAGTVQTLQVPSAPGSSVRIQLTLQGRPCTLELNPVDLRARDFRVLLDDGAALRQAQVADPGTYQGGVTGLRRARVAATVAGGQLWAMIHTTAGVFGVQPLDGRRPGAPRDAHVVYEARDVVVGGTCGVLDLPAPDTAPGGGSLGGANQMEAEIALDCDNAYYNRKSQSATRVQTDAMRIINAMDVVYQRDVGIRYKVTAIVIRTTKVYAGTTPSALLPEMRTRWNNQHRAIRRDLAHLFTGVGSFSGVVGVAYVGVVCGSSAYGVSKAFAGTLIRNAGLVSHECGHNWSAGHCNNNPPCFIMCSGLGGCGGDLTRFGTQAKNQIIRHRDSRGCLRTLTPGTYAFFGGGCSGSNQRVPDLVSPSVPQVGQRFTLQVTGGRASAPATLWYGASDTRWGALTLPFDLGVIGAPGCRISASADLQIAAMTDALGVASVTVTVPNDTVFVGTRFFNQAFVADPGANAAGLALTRVGSGRVGY